jgi:hypothetical protein
MSLGAGQLGDPRRLPRFDVVVDLDPIQLRS